VALLFSFLLSMYWRLEARTIRHCGDLAASSRASQG